MGAVGFNPVLEHSSFYLTRYSGHSSCQYNKYSFTIPNRGENKSKQNGSKVLEKFELELTFIEATFLLSSMSNPMPGWELYLGRISSVHCLAGNYM